MWPVVVFAFLAVVAVRAWGEEPRVFPSPQHLLVPYNRSDISRFREWRAEMIQAIHTTIANSRGPDKCLWDGREVDLAMQWAGEIRATELIPILIEQIDLKVVGNELRSREDRYPAVRALILIGMPAVSPCLEALASENDRVRRENLVLVLWNVEGRGGGKALIEHALQEEGDPERRANLEAALALFAKDRPPR